MPVAIAACVLAAAAWAYLLAGHGGFWRTDQRLPRPVRPAAPAESAGPPGQSGSAGPAPAADPPTWPAVTAIVPARDEASGLPDSLPTLLSQDYPGRLAVTLVDDQSSDGTAAVASALGRAAGWTAGGAGPGAGPEGSGQVSLVADADRTLRVVAGSPTPAGWAGKVWAMSQGLAEAGDADYLLFTDADIAYGPGAVTDLVRAAAGGQRALVSQMALLRADTGWERVLVPAFVYFFAQLYPFRRVNRPGGRTAAAAGGCMLVDRAVLTAAGGLAAIRGARIDDVALGRLLKRGAGASCWLGLTRAITSTRPYDRLTDLWDMIARSAYTQLRYSPAALAGTIAGLLWLYLLPPVAGIAGVAGLALSGGGPGGGGPGRGGLGSAAAAAWLAGAGLAGWALMSVSFLPMLRLYRLSPLRALSLPLIALMYAAMTADSARRHHAGRGGEWKGRTIQAASAPTGTDDGPVTGEAVGSGRSV